jgi:hypothetical protein
MLLPVFMLALAPAMASPGAWKPVELLDINRASIQELLRVPGMTPSWAARIVRFRALPEQVGFIGTESGDLGGLSAYSRWRDCAAHR